MIIQNKIINLEIETKMNGKCPALTEGKISKWRWWRAALLLLCLIPFGSKATNVALIGSNGNANMAIFLAANGFSVTDFGTSIPSAGTLASYNAVVLLRMDGNSTIANWVNNGGVLVTEWSAADWAITTAGLLSATATMVGSVGTGTSITFAASSLGNQLGTGLTNPYSDGGASEFFYNFTGLGGSVQILATRPTNLPAIIAGPSGTGYTFIVGYDWADGFPSGSSNSGTLLKNILNSGMGGSLPAPANPASVSATYNILCNGASTQLTATGASGTVYWYTGSCGGTQVTTGNPVTVTPAASTTYFARNYNNSQFSAGCASVSIVVNPRPTVADLQATGTGIKWYLTQTGGTALLGTTQLINNQHYWASQTVNGRESTARFEVTVTMTNP